ncbi:MAG: transcription elongation factor subunit Spt4 [Nanobdellota archaeon]
MAKKKVCKNCKYIVGEETDECPNCGSKGQWNETYQGRVYVFDTEKSIVGNKIDAKTKGEYAIRSRS